MPVVARMRKKQQCSSIYTEMLLIRDGPARSVLGPGRSGTVRSSSGMVRDGPRSSVLTPCWVRDGPWWSGFIRVGSVYIRSAAVLGPGWSGVTMFFDGRSSVEGPSKHFTPGHPGSRHLLVRVVSGLSGMVRVGSGFGVT